MHACMRTYVLIRTYVRTYIYSYGVYTRVDGETARYRLVVVTLVYAATYTLLELATATQQWRLFIHRPLRFILGVCVPALQVVVLVRITNMLP